MGRAIKKKQDKWYLILPLAFVVSVIPVIVFMKMITLDDTTFQAWTSSTNVATDFFSYYKAVLICISAIIMGVLFFVRNYNADFKKKSMLYYYLPLAVYVLFVLISTGLSKFPITARNGFVDRYEGLYVLLSYMVILLFAINIDYNERTIKIITIALFLSAAIIGIIGVFQFVGYDLFKSSFGKSLILPLEYQSAKDSLAFNFGKFTIYSTLYNTNYVGSYTAMLFPISFICYIYARKRSVKILSALFTCLMFATWIGCRSRAGYVGGIFALILVLVFFRKKLIQNFKFILPVIGGFAVIFISMNIVSGGELASRFSDDTTMNTASATQSNSTGSTPVSGRAEYLKDIVFGDRNVSIVCTTETLTLTLNQNQMSFQDTEGKDLTISVADNIITFQDARYAAYKLEQQAEQNTIDVHAGTMKIPLYVHPDGFKMIGVKGKLINVIEQPESFGFDGNEKFASARGYIWSRSLPILKKTILAGSGPDTYAIVFPQQDYVGKLRAFDGVNQLIDKPHNMYLQTGINTGVISLLAIIVLFAVYFISSIRLYFKREYSNISEVTGLAAFVAFCGYAVAGFFNDSLVSVAPVFWAIMGVGIACNYMIKNGKLVKEVGGKAAILQKNNVQTRKK